MPSNKLNSAQLLGRWAEQQAAHMLIQAGYTLLMQNYHSQFGEIDLIAQKGEELIFVEVKARKPTQRGRAFEVITASKQMKIIKTALLYIQQNVANEALYYRFDVICFDFLQQFAKNPQQDFSELAYDQQWIENAFTLDADLINL